MRAEPGKYEHGAINEKRQRTPKYAAGDDKDKIRKKRPKPPKDLEFVKTILTFIILILIYILIKNLR